ncbi:hypothetical protein EJB05_37477 [Eragrostis curvula]|uniref:uracil phosphoribosyltransferase n=1 Tax=Eragrostis curvula TaxID=38414 RepID=A0A5J9TRQ8_9POAL|nr:hypothetical protein EJB05_37477 [Eragrostis curvula]
MDGIKVVVPAHPLVKHWVSVLRNRDTPTAAFKTGVAELGRTLTYEATKDWLPTVTKEVQSPLGACFVESIDETQPIMIVPILRAGLAFAEHATSLLPSTKTFHLGMARDEKTLQPSVYLNKLPDQFPDGCRILLMDPMLATSGTMAAAIELIKDRGADVEQIRIISAITCPPAIERLRKKFPGISVYVAAVDPVLNEKGFMIPGLGDAGDRIYGT